MKKVLPIKQYVYILLIDYLKKDILVTKECIKRTVCFKELNLSFFTRDDVLFDFGWESGLKIFSCPEDKEAKLLQSLYDRLFTVLTTLNIHPYIQCQSSSKFCTILSEKIVFKSNRFTKNLKKRRYFIIN